MNLRKYLMIKTAGRTKQAAMFGDSTENLTRFFQREKIDPRVAKRIRMYGDDGFVEPYTAAMLRDQEARNEAAEDFGFDPAPIIPEVYDTDPLLRTGPDRESFVKYTRNRSPEEAAKGINRDAEDMNALLRYHLMRNVPPSRQDYIDAGYKSDPLKPLNRYFRDKGLSQVYYPEPDVDDDDSVAEEVAPLDY